MKAMILAAGFGTRLRPLTLERAKPAIPMLGEPLIVRLLRKLQTQNVSQFRVNLHHLPDSLSAIFDHTDSEFSVSFSTETEILGTAGGLKANESYFDETFIMANGDIAAEFPVAPALEFHRRRDALATLLLFEQHPPFRYFPVKIDHDNRLRNFKNAAPSKDVTPETYVFTGIHILDPRIFDYIPDNGFCDINNDVYPPALRNDERIYGFPVQGYWNDVGDPMRYLQAQRDLFLLERSSPYTQFHRSVSVCSGSETGPFVSAGDHCVFEPESFVRNSILWDRVIVHEGAVVQNSIIGSDVELKGRVCNKIITVHGEADIES